MTETATFQQELNYVEMGFNDPQDPSSVGLVPVKKTATFKELSRTDKSQHHLAMYMTKKFRAFSKPTGEFDNEGKEIYKFSLEDEETYDMTVRFVETNLVPTADFDAKDAKEFLNDVVGISELGTALFQDKFLPFFAILLSRFTN